MGKSEIPFLSAAELSRLIEKKEVSPVDVIGSYLDRIDDVGFKFNAYLTVCRKEAMEEAKEAEQAIAGGNYLGPMHGIPFTVKDQLWSKGVRSTGGSRQLADFVPDEDATVIANLKMAGAILLGKANVTEFGITAFTHRYSIPRNPWNLDMNTGASSSGSGAATAAFLCATSLGGDTLGSVRWPASWCGLVGLRPSFGRVSRYGFMTGIWSMDAVGPMSRTVEDAAITLGAIAGHDPKDPYTWNTPVPNYQNCLDGDIRHIRVGVVKEMLHSDGVAPEVHEAVLKAADVLGELGASVDEVSIPLSIHAPYIFPALRIETPMNHREGIRERLQEYGPENRRWLLTGSIIPAQAFYKAQKLRSMLRWQVHEALEGHQVLLTPTCKIPAQPIQDYQPVTSKEMAGRPSSLLTFIEALANTPAISVPCGFSSDGLPIGLHLGGRAGEEETVLNVAHAYEQHTPWHTRRPTAA